MIFLAGFVPGETIQFQVDVDNKTSRVAKNITVKLVQIAKFQGKITFGPARSILKTSKRFLSSAEWVNSVEGNTKGCWKGLLKIPPTCASSNDTCGIIDVSYCLYLSFEPSTDATDLRIPITIGNWCI